MLGRMSDLDFSCPRCGAAAHEAFYGPCATCRLALRALGGERREVERVDYEPKMNVTPNAVAVKDD
jgi:ribosomal protein L37E